MAVVLGMYVLLPFFAFSSALILMKDTPHFFHWIFNSNFVNSAIKGSLQSIFGLDRPKLNCQDIYCRYSYPKQFLKDFDAHVSLHISLSILLTYAILSRIIAFALLKY